MVSGDPSTEISLLGSIWGKASWSEAKSASNCSDVRVVGVPPPMYTDTTCEPPSSSACISSCRRREAT